SHAARAAPTASDGAAGRAIRVAAATGCMRTNDKQLRGRKQRGKSELSRRGRAWLGHNGTYFAPSSANCAPCGSTHRTIHCPPGTSSGAVTIVPPPAFTLGTAAATLGTLK